jgi:hypothetical protein
MLCWYGSQIVSHLIQQHKIALIKLGKSHLERDINHLLIYYRPPIMSFMVANVVFIVVLVSNPKP